MFTGLVEEVGRLVRLDRVGAAAQLVVAADFPPDDISIGDSIAVNGACLTVTAKGGGTFSFDVSPETIQRTALRHLHSGAPVNLERALRLSDRLGGHIVTGHVDCVARVLEKRQVSGNTLFSFQLPDDYARYLVTKGSVAIDGISLTLNSVQGGTFSINAIPLTIAATTLRTIRPGDEVNIETDIIGKYVERLLSRTGVPSSAGLSMELLEKSGFL